MVESNAVYNNDNDDNDKLKVSDNDHNDKLKVILLFICTLLKMQCFLSYKKYNFNNFYSELLLVMGWHYPEVVTKLFISLGNLCQYYISY